MTINGIIGAGIFGLPSKVYGLIGGYSLIAFVACALVVMLIILCFAEVGQLALTKRVGLTCMLAKRLDQRSRLKWAG